MVEYHVKDVLCKADANSSIDSRRTRGNEATKTSMHIERRTMMLAILQYFESLKGLKKGTLSPRSGYLYKTKWRKCEKNSNDGI